MTSCARFEPYLSAAQDEIDASTATAVSEHVATCAACRAEVTRFTALRRTLGDIALHEPDAPADLVAAIIGRTPEHRARRALPMLPVPPVELARVLQDNRDAILTAGAAAAVTAGAVWLAWRSLRSARRGSPQQA